MSDITKKIFSIEQAEDAFNSSELPKSDILRPLAKDTIQGEKAENVPEFVTRETVQPRLSPPSNIDDMVKPPKTAGWLILCFGLLYLIGAGLYFGMPLLDRPLGLIPIAGLAILLVLPLILLFLLWRTLRHLSLVSFQNARISKAAEVLVSPDREALHRTESLAAGIRNEISKVNSSLLKTVEVYQDVQGAVTRQSQALDAAGLTLTDRSSDVSQSLTLQREALETMSTEIVESSQSLAGICTDAETKLLSASEALKKATVIVDETVGSSAILIEDKIAILEGTSQKMTESSGGLTSSLNASSESLLQTESAFADNSSKLEALNAKTQAQITELQGTIGQGYEMLSELREAAAIRASVVATHYDSLSSQIKQSEDDTLAAQGKTARMVETNLAQMRRDFSRMETDLKALQAKLNNVRSASKDIEEDIKPAGLNLVPLDSDFPPVEPSRHVPKPARSRKPTTKYAAISETPLNLGADMEVASIDEPLINYEPDLIRRPGDVNAKSKAKGFGRRKDKEEKSGWRWRDMLGTLERPDGQAGLAPAASSPRNTVNAVALLTGVKLSPGAVVDEGTVVDATQARIDRGDAGLTSVVMEKLPEAVGHLKGSLNADAGLRADLRSFTSEFSNMISNTPPTAPALRAALGSPEGRAYLLCAAAFKPELRG